MLWQYQDEGNKAEFSFPAGLSPHRAVTEGNTEGPYFLRNFQPNFYSLVFAVIWFLDSQCLPRLQQQCVEMVLRGKWYLLSPRLYYYLPQIIILIFCCISVLKFLSRLLLSNSFECVFIFWAFEVIVFKTFLIISNLISFLTGAEP